MRILVTGGTGFIGSHTCIELINAGYDVVIADNLYNSKALVVDRIEELAGKRPVFYEVDVTDKPAMNELFDKEKIDAVIHFAGYKAVGESTRKPIEYYHSATLCGITASRKSSSHPPRQYTAIPPLSRLQRNARWVSARTRTARQRLCRSAF